MPQIKVEFLHFVWCVVFGCQIKYSYYSYATNLISWPCLNAFVSMLCPTSQEIGGLRISFKWQSRLQVTLFRISQSTRKQTTGTIHFCWTNGGQDLRFCLGQTFLSFGNYFAFLKPLTYTVSTRHHVLIKTLFLTDSWQTKETFPNNIFSPNDHSLSLMPGRGVRWDFCAGPTWYFDNWKPAPSSRSVIAINSPKYRLLHCTSSLHIPLPRFS